MIQSAILSPPYAGRATAPAAGARAGAGEGAATFASLLGGGDGKAGDDQPAGAATGDPAATDRQDDAVAGNPVPTTDPASPMAADAAWLALILAEPMPAAVPSLAERSGGNAAASSPVAGIVAGAPPAPPPPAPPPPAPVPPALTGQARARGPSLPDLAGRIPAALPSLSVASFRQAPETMPSPVRTAAASATDPQLFAQSVPSTAAPVDTPASQGAIVTTVSSPAMPTVAARPAPLLAEASSVPSTSPLSAIPDRARPTTLAPVGLVTATVATMPGAVASRAVAAAPLRSRSLDTRPTPASVMASPDAAVAADDPVMVTAATPVLVPAVPDRAGPTTAAPVGLATATVATMPDAVASRAVAAAPLWSRSLDTRPAPASVMPAETPVAAGIAAAAPVLVPAVPDRAGPTPVAPVGLATATVATMPDAVASRAVPAVSLRSRSLDTRPVPASVMPAGTPVAAGIAAATPVLGSAIPDGAGPTTVAPIGLATATMPGAVASRAVPAAPLRSRSLDNRPAPASVMASPDAAVAADDPVMVTAATPVFVPAVPDRAGPTTVVPMGLATATVATMPDAVASRAVAAAPLWSRSLDTRPVPASAMPAGTPVAAGIAAATPVLGPAITIDAPLPGFASIPLSAIPDRAGPTTAAPVGLATATMPGAVASRAVAAASLRPRSLDTRPAPASVMASPDAAVAADDPVTGGVADDAFTAMAATPVPVPVATAVVAQPAPIVIDAALPGLASRPPAAIADRMGSSDIVTAGRPTITAATVSGAPMLSDSGPAAPAGYRVPASAPLSPSLPGIAAASVAPAASAGVPPMRPPVIADPAVTLAVAGPIVAVPAANPAVQPAPALPAEALPAQNPASPAPATLRVVEPETLPAAPAAQVPVPAAAAIRSAVIAPAGEVFAAAIHAAGRDQRDGDGVALQQAPAIAATVAAVPGGVAPASDRGDATLDMRHGGWPGAMVEHIEKLRDAADATDTRIRLVPDALGSIDVSLSRHDDGVRVTLAADHPATQAMLADARPQLTELAQARGLRLADAAVSSGGGQGFADAQRQPSPPVMPSAPASAATITDDPDSADSRVA